MCVCLCYDAAETIETYCCGAEDDIDIITVVRDNVLHETRHVNNRRWSNEGSLLSLEQEPMHTHTHTHTHFPMLGTFWLSPVRKANLV